MFLIDLLHVLSKEKRRKEQIKAAQNIAVGIGIVATVSVVTGNLSAPKSGGETCEDMKKKTITTVETIKDTFHVIKDTPLKTVTIDNLGEFFATERELKVI